MDFIEYVKAGGVALVAVLLLLLVRDIYINEIAFPRKNKAAGGGSFVIRGSYPFGLSLLYRMIKEYLAHDVNEYVRRDILNKSHTIYFNICGFKSYMTEDPEIIKAVLATKFNDFSLGTRYEAFVPLLGEGIFTLSGEGWKHSRTMLRPQFDRNQITHLGSVKEHTDKLILRLDDAFKAGQLVDVQELFHKLTLDTATEFLFGESTDTLDYTPKVFKTARGNITGDDFCEAFNRSQTMIGLRVIMVYFYRFADSFRFRKDIKTCKAFIDTFVQKALEKPMEKDQVGERFIFTHELTKETRDPLVMRDQAFNILLAGRDTTASLMSFLACYMATHPECYQKLREEVLQTFGEDDTTITFESVKRCTYLTWCLNEALRLHPIVAFNFRRAVRDTLLPRGGGPNGEEPLLVEAGQTIAYSPYAMQRNHEYWGEDADEFKPERWAEIKNVGWKYLPFNGGPRICLGQQFALVEMGVVWIKLAQTYKNIESTWTKEKLYRPKMHHRVTVSADGGVPARFTR